MKHIPVLLEESIRGLNLKKGNIFVDGTLGGGGHSNYVCQKYNNQVKVIGIEVDEQIIKEAEKILKDCNVQIQRSNFQDLDKVLNKLGVEEIDAILLDLGLNSYQLDESGRGFSFQRDEPLLMTMKKDISDDDLTAKLIINEWSEDSLKDIFYGYGEERFAKVIAHKIVELREEKEIETTFDLVDIIKKAIPVWYQKKKGIHYATKTFQAIRIAVNDELRILEKGLEIGFKYLKNNGRLVVISFHSLVDRLVTRFFTEKSKEKIAILITKKPISPGQEEIQKNPRSRSAKLRILEKIS